MSLSNYSDVTRNIATKREQPNPDDVHSDDVDRQQTINLLDALAGEEQAKRKALEDATARRDEGLIRVLKLHRKLMNKYNRLKKRERVLSTQAGQLLKTLKTEEGRVDKLAGAVTRIQKQRKQELAKITEPAWAIPHHYHMTAVEHSLGHSQPHVLDVGSMIRGHLRIFAVANATVRFTKNASHVLVKSKSSKTKVSDNIKAVYTELRLTRNQMKEIERMFDAFRHRIGDPKKLSYLKVDDERSEMGRREREDDNESFALPLVPESPMLDLDNMSSTTRDRSPSVESAPMDSPTVMRIPMDNMSPPSSPSATPRFGSAVAPDSPRAAPVPGYRNIKMKFFQALNLTPPALKESQKEATAAADEFVAEADEKAMSASVLEQAQASAAAKPLSAEETMAAEWTEVNDVFKALDPLDKAKQVAWEELEAVLDHRERLKFEASQLGQSVPYQ